ncbi:Prefoldin subunit 6, variant 2 [Pleurotus ostreatus]|nr:Prefoldin subunit 6, variant 2 [Pleurotus ostreatus]
MSLQAKLQVVTSEFQKLQIDLSNAVEARQRLEAQLSENQLVKKEFDQLKPESVVYKQIGPVLVKQDQSEAKSNVDTRLEFITGEIKRVESQIKEIEQKSEKKKTEVSQESHKFDYYTLNRRDPPSFIRYLSSRRLCSNSKQKLANQQSKLNPPTIHKICIRRGHGVAEDYIGCGGGGSGEVGIRCFESLAC